MSSNEKEKHTLSKGKAKFKRGKVSNSSFVSQKEGDENVAERTGQPNFFQRKKKVKEKAKEKVLGKTAQGFSSPAKSDDSFSEHYKPTNAENIKGFERGKILPKSFLMGKGSEQSHKGFVVTPNEMPEAGREESKEEGREEIRPLENRTLEKQKNIPNVKMPAKGKKHPSAFRRDDGEDVSDGAPEGQNTRFFKPHDYTPTASSSNDKPQAHPFFKRGSGTGKTKSYASKTENLVADPGPGEEVPTDGQFVKQPKQQSIKSNFQKSKKQDKKVAKAEKSSSASGAVKRGKTFVSGSGRFVKGFSQSIDKREDNNKTAGDQVASTISQSVVLAKNAGSFAAASGRLIAKMIASVISGIASVFGGVLGCITPVIFFVPILICLVVVIVSSVITSVISAIGSLFTSDDTEASAMYAYAYVCAVKYVNECEVYLSSVDRAVVYIDGEEYEASGEEITIDFLTVYATYLILNGGDAYEDMEALTEATDENKSLFDEVFEGFYSVELETAEVETEESTTEATESSTQGETSASTEATESSAQSETSASTEETSEAALSETVVAISIKTLDGYLEDLGMEDLKSDISLLVDAYADLVILADDLEMTIEDAEVSFTLP